MSATRCADTERHNEWKLSHAEVALSRDRLHPTCAAASPCQARADSTVSARITGVGAACTARKRDERETDDRHPEFGKIVT